MESERSKLEELAREYESLKSKLDILTTRVIEEIVEIPFEELSPEEQRRVMKIKKRLKELEKNKELMEFIKREREKRMKEVIEGFKRAVSACAERHRGHTVEEFWACIKSHPAVKKKK